MENTRIYKILSTLSAPTLNRFSKFIQSPYHNVNQRITTMVLQLINDIKKKNAVISKKEYWKLCSLEGEYNDLKFRKLCNDALDRFEQFLIVEQLNHDILLKANLLVNSLKENNFKILIEKHLNKSVTLFDRTIDRSSDYFLQKYQFDRTVLNLKSNYEKKEDIKKFLIGENYKNLPIQLEVFYVIEKLRQSIDSLTWSKQYKTTLIDTISPLEVNLIKKNINNISVKIYYSIFILMSSKRNDEEYFNLKYLAMKNFERFPKSEQREIFDALFSYCIRNVNLNIKIYLSEYLELNEWGVKNQIILKKGILSPTSFRNYVVIGLRAGEFDKVENYINNNSKLLENSRRENALNFNLARLSWYKKEYDDTLTFLNKVNYDDIWYNVNSKNYLLATYYELEEWDLLESNLNSYSNFLRREKSLSSNSKDRYLKFSKYLYSLLRHGYNENKLSEIKSKINIEKNVLNKEWLLEKIDEKLKSS